MNPESGEKKVLQLINGVRLLGAEQVAIGIACNLSASNYGSVVGLINGDIELKKKVEALVPSSCQVELFSGAGGFLGTFFRVFIFIRQNMISIIHSHGYKSNFISLIMKIMNPSILVIATNHTYKKTTFKERIYAFIDSRILRFFNQVTAVSESTKFEVIGNGIAADTVPIIDNGVDLSKLQYENSAVVLRHELNLPSTTILGGVVASLTPEKAHTDLFAAMKTICQAGTDFSLVVLGDGPLRENLQQVVLNLGLSERVFFLGHRGDVLSWLSAIDIFILPSHLEGLPMALLEAMGIGLPVVATSVGSIPKVINDGENGFIVPPGQPELLSEKISILINNASMRYEFGAAARQTVESCYSSSVMAQQYEKLYFHMGVGK